MKRLIALLVIMAFFATLLLPAVTLAGDWIYSDPSGIHVTTSYYKADSDSTGELAFKFLNGTDVASGFKYVQKTNWRQTNPVVNNGFENGDAVAYNWTADPLGTGHKITRDTDDKHSGSASLRIVTSNANSYSYIKSNAVAVSTKAVIYKISFWSKSNSTTGINSQVRITTQNASGTDIRNLLLIAKSDYTTSWTESTYYGWTRFASKEATYRIYIFYQDLATRTDVHFDDISIQQWVMDETPNSAHVTTTFTEPTADTAVISNSFTQNGVKVAREYQVSRTSPLITAQVVLTYPTTDTIAEETMLFKVESKTGYVTLDSNQNLIDMTTENNTVWYSPANHRNYADRWSAKVALFSNNVSLVEDTALGWYLERSQSAAETSIEYIADSVYAHTYVNRATYPDMFSSTMSLKSHVSGEKYTMAIYFSCGVAINSNTFPIQMRQPNGFLATWINTNHADADENRRMKALLFGHEDRTKIVNGSGFLGLGLPMTLSVFPFSTTQPTTPMGLDNADYLATMRAAQTYGVEVIPHSVTNSETAISNASTNARLNTMDEFDSVTWIDHGGVSVNTHMYGWNASNPSNYYILPQLLAHGYKYSWDFSDIGSYFNLYDVEAYSNAVPFVNLAHPHSQAGSLWEFSTLKSGSTNTWVPERLTEATGLARLNSLVAQRGTTILHSYMTMTSLDSYHVSYSGGKYSIASDLQTNLENLAVKMYVSREIWVTTIRDFMDYLLQLQYVTLLPSYSVANRYFLTCSQAISGYTLNFGSNLAYALLDGERYVATKDARLWLPSISAGTHTIDVSFGSTSATVPRVQSSNAESYVSSWMVGGFMQLALKPRYADQTITTVVHVGNQGEPRRINGATSWAYDEATSTVTVVSRTDLLVDWTYKVIDAAGINAHWYPGPPLGPLGYDSSFDINGDGVIDVVDAAIVSAFWDGPPRGPLAP